MKDTQTRASFRYGIIYPMAEVLVQVMFHLNLVELFKAIAKKLARRDEDIPKNASIATDIFVFLKWATLIYLWGNGINHPLATILVAYLIISSVYTYFYYHVWCSAFDSSFENQRRRFVNILLSLAFNTVGFAYLYHIPFNSHFLLTGTLTHPSASFLLSASRSVFVDFDQLSAVTSIGHALALLQTLTVFLYISIVLSVSIPQANADKP